jgi:hypothetical protein
MGYVHLLSNRRGWTGTAMTTTTEPIVPVWLTLEDFDVLERCLEDYAASQELEPELEQHLARLVTHFKWVRGEFIAHQR